jgi:hypothetical protein
VRGVQGEGVTLLFQANLGHAWGASAAVPAAKQSAMRYRYRFAVRMILFMVGLG